MRGVTVESVGYSRSPCFYFLRIAVRRCVIVESVGYSRSLCFYFCGEGESCGR